MWRLLTGRCSVNNLPLPGLMVRLIKEGRWRRPKDEEILVRLTRIVNAHELDFLTLREMCRESENDFLVQSEVMARIYGLASSVRQGRPILDPTILDVDMRVMFAINWDEDALCLDYRTSTTDPRVVVSRFSEGRGHWEPVTETFTGFAEILRL